MPLGIASDQAGAEDSPIGRMFYVMAFVDGLVLRDAAAATSIPSEARRQASHSIADTLAKIHAVDCAHCPADNP